MKTLFPLDEKEIVQEIGRSLVDAELEKLFKLKTEPIPLKVAHLCDDLISYLSRKLADTLDGPDLLALRKDIDDISDLIRLFHATSEQRSSWWAKPLLKECYAALGLDWDSRLVLIIHSERVHANDLNEYVVYADLLSLLGDRFHLTEHPVIDVYQVPLEARHDLASIALVAHEVGHVFFQNNMSVITQKVDEADLSSLLAPESGNDQGDLFISDARQKEKKKIGERVTGKIEEYVCDAIGRHLLGPAFDFSLIKHLAPLTPFTGVATNPPSSHPPHIARIRSSWARLKKAAKQYRKEASDSPLSHCLERMDRSWEALIRDARKKRRPKQKFNREDAFAKQLAIQIITEQPATSEFKISDLEACWKKVAPELIAFRPPFETVDADSPVAISPIEALQISVLYYYGRHYLKENEFYQNSKDADERKAKIVRENLIAHLTYAISLHDFIKLGHSKYCGASFPKEKLRTTLWHMRDLKTQGKPTPVVVTPSIYPEKQYGSNSIDLRLSQFFLVHKAPRFTHLQPSPKPTDGSRSVPIEEFYEEVYKPVGDTFILHPHQFVLGSTLEYVSLPSKYYALVLGRSTWGRLGLNIATATTVQAGYKGCLTLELRNLGETPLPLTVGTRVAQLCLIAVPSESTPGDYFVEGGKYVGPVRPEIPKIRDDPDWRLLLQE